LTLKDLQKAIQSQAEAGNMVNHISQELQGLPFWIFDQQQHRQEGVRTGGNCCFWHSLGCPQKDGHDMPLLPYQRTIYEALQNYKHLWTLKSRGIGLSSFMLRYIAWLCVSPQFRRNSRVCIITGPRLDLAEDLIARFKGLFSFDELVRHNGRTASTVAIVNGVKVEAFPSHHVDAMRGLDNVKFILSD
jgi:hypothetical protein